MDGEPGEDRRTETVRAVLELAAPLARSATVDSVAGALARSALSALDAVVVAVVVEPDVAGRVPGARGIAAIDRSPASIGEIVDRLVASPWCAAMTRADRPSSAGLDELDDEGAALLGALGATAIDAHPLAVPGEHLGCVLVFWGPDADRSDPELALRARAIRDFGTMAVRSASLLAQLRHRALHDGLTGLANRQLFLDRLDRALASARRHHRTLVVITLDLDGFKPINDELGHEAGDEVLAVLGRRLAGALREEDTLARLGGDEFGVLLPELDEPAVAAEVADKVRGVISEPIDLGSDRVAVTPSVGIAVFPHDGRTREELMRHADVALYRAKSLGRDRVVRFERSLLTELERRTGLEADLRDAIVAAASGDDQLVLEYQPQVDLADGRISGLEALVRWDHPTRGRLTPGDFLDAAEDSGLVVALDTWVLTRACRDMNGWRAQELAVPRVCVNVSSRDLRDPVFVEVLGEILERTDVPPGALELEVRDGLPLDDDGVADAALVRLRRRGVRFAVDDFGVRRSELGQLRVAPIDTVKIDRRFTAEIVDEARSAPSTDGPRGLLVDGIVALCTALGLRSVACGVETELQQRHLTAIGCDAVQGWLYADAIDADLVARLLVHAAVRPVEVA